MPTSIKLEDLNYAELLELATKAQAEAERKREAGLSEAVEFIKSELANRGFAISDLIGFLESEQEVPPSQTRRPRSDKGLTFAPKYQHPENPELTWSGRGRKPQWLSEAVAAGVPIETFLIKDSQSDESNP